MSLYVLEHFQHKNGLLKFTILEAPLTVTMIMRLIPFYVTSPGIAINDRQPLSMIQFIGNTSDKEDGAI